GEQPSRPPKVAGSNKLFRQLPGLIKKNVFSIPNVTPVSIDSGPFDGVDSQPLIFETDDELRYPIGAGLVDELADRAGAFQELLQCSIVAGGCEALCCGGGRLFHFWLPLFSLYRNSSARAPALQPDIR